MEPSDAIPDPCHAPEEAGGRRARAQERQQGREASGGGLDGQDLKRGATPCTRSASLDPDILLAFQEWEEQLVGQERWTELHEMALVAVFDDLLHCLLLGIEIRSVRRRCMAVFQHRLERLKTTCPVVVVLAEDVEERVRTESESTVRGRRVLEALFAMRTTHEGGLTTQQAQTLNALWKHHTSEGWKGFFQALTKAKCRDLRLIWKKTQKNRSRKAPM